jgi:predicted O-methyltransferase YrrM
VNADRRWDEVEEWIASRLIPRDEVLEEAVRAAERGGLPSIQVEPTTGKLLYLLARMAGAKRILEIGTLGGYSTIWLARALPADGRLITIEANPDYAAVAQGNIDRAGVGELVELRVEPALDALPGLREDGNPFDMVFIDADKANQDSYLSWALDLARPGAVIVGDNVVRGGRVLDSDNEDPSIQGIRRFMDLLASEPRIDATAIQTVGSKGYDGFAVGIVAEPGD